VESTATGGLPPANLVSRIHRSVIYDISIVYTEHVTKHLIDLDEDALSAAQAELGTTTIKDTVNRALEQATSDRQRRVASALDVLAAADITDRSEAWR
jgi:Arc/MetJ family transcription regulator